MNENYCTKMQTADDNISINQLIKCSCYLQMLRLTFFSYVYIVSLFGSKGTTAHGRLTLRFVCGMITCLLKIMCVTDTIFRVEVKFQMISSTLTQYIFIASITDGMACLRLVCMHCHCYPFPFIA